MRSERPSFCTVRVWVLTFLAGMLLSCTSMYYETMEALGQHKRDILVDRVADARDEQDEAKEQFVSALDTFTALVGAEDSDLRRRYDALNGELDRCETKASNVRSRIDSIEKVSHDLFREWETELERYTSDELRRRSRDTLARTRGRYEQMISAMRRPEEKMESVLVAFRDQVLFLKHNLNAQAVASLQGTFDALELDTAQLVREMEAAIAEANAFIESMESAA